MVRASEAGYDGIPYGELRFVHVDWTHRADYIRTRRDRKGTPAEFNVEPEWATEAVIDDPKAVVAPTPGSKSGATLSVVGYSSGASRLLVVTLLAKDEPAGDSWWGVNAWAANDSAERRYREAQP